MINAVNEVGRGIKSKIRKQNTGRQRDQSQNIERENEPSQITGRQNEENELEWVSFFIIKNSIDYNLYHLRT